MFFVPPWAVFLGLVLCVPACVQANTGTWATVPMSVMPNFTNYDYFSPCVVPTLVGTPPQQMNLTVNVATDLLATYSVDCILCIGPTLFNPSMSSTFKTNNTAWPSSIPSFSGVEVSDTVGFAGLLSAEHQNFVNILDGSNKTYASKFWNGHLGLFPNPLNATSLKAHLLSRLYESNSLLNPVIGMRFDPANPKITIGALDPNDYEGTINWVQMNPSPDPNGDYLNTFSIDGVKGYDNEFVPIPIPGNLNAALDSLSIDISFPNTSLYFNNINSTGPIPPVISGSPTTWDYGYNCTFDSTDLFEPPEELAAEPLYVALTVTINGVDYQIDSTDNLLRPKDGSFNSWACPVGIKNRTATATPNVVLGLPFLRSVYLAYRFPTDDCPGYYGFAFPSGSNRTQAQISQKPAATPTNSGQCLSLVAPASTPSAKVVLAQAALASKGTYAVYGEQGVQVPLMAVEELPKIVWDWTTVLG